jgi:hypothetical protein
MVNIFVTAYLGAVAANEQMAARRADGMRIGRPR